MPEDITDHRAHNQLRCEPMFEDVEALSAVWTGR